MHLVRSCPRGLNRLLRRFVFITVFDGMHLFAPIRGGHAPHVKKQKTTKTFVPRPCAIHRCRQRSEPSHKWRTFLDGARESCLSLFRSPRAWISIFEWRPQKQNSNRFPFFHPSLLKFPPQFGAVHCSVIACRVLWNQLPELGKDKWAIPDSVSQYRHESHKKEVTVWFFSWLRRRNASPRRTGECARRVPGPHLKTT